MKDIAIRLFQLYKERAEKVKFSFSIDAIFIFCVIQIILFRIGFYEIHVFKYGALYDRLLQIYRHYVQFIPNLLDILKGLLNVTLVISSLFVAYFLIKNIIKNKLISLLSIFCFSFFGFLIIRFCHINPTPFDILLPLWLLSILLALYRSNGAFSFLKTFFYTLTGGLICFFSNAAILMFFVFLAIMYAKYLVETKLKSLNYSIAPVSFQLAVKLIDNIIEKVYLIFKKYEEKFFRVVKLRKENFYFALSMEVLLIVSVVQIILLNNGFYETHVFQYTELYDNIERTYKYLCEVIPCFRFLFHFSIKCFCIISPIITLFFLVKKILKNKKLLTGLIVAFAIGFIALVKSNLITINFIELMIPIWLLMLLVTMYNSQEELPFKKFLLYTILGGIFCWLSKSSILMFFIYYAALIILYLIKGSTKHINNTFTTFLTVSFVFVAENISKRIFSISKKCEEKFFQIIKLRKENFYFALSMEVLLIVSVVQIILLNNGFYETHVFQYTWLYDLLERTYRNLIETIGGLEFFLQFALKVIYVIAPIVTLYFLVKKILKNKKLLTGLIVAFAIGFIALVKSNLITINFIELMIPIWLLMSLVTMYNSQEELPFKKFLLYTILGGIFCWLSKSSILMFFIYYAALIILYLIKGSTKHINNTFTTFLTVGFVFVIEKILKSINYIVIKLFQILKESIKKTYWVLINIQKGISSILKKCEEKFFQITKLRKENFYFGFSMDLIFVVCIIKLILLNNGYYETHIFEYSELYDHIHQAYRKLCADITGFSFLFNSLIRCFCVIAPIVTLYFLVKKILKNKKLLTGLIVAFVIGFIALVKSNLITINFIELMLPILLLMSLVTMYNSQEELPFKKFLLYTILGGIFCWLSKSSILMFFVYYAALIILYLIKGSTKHINNTFTTFYIVCFVFLIEKILKCTKYIIIKLYKILKENTGKIYFAFVLTVLFAGIAIRIMLFWTHHYEISGDDCNTMYAIFRPVKELFTEFVDGANFLPLYALFIKIIHSIFKFNWFFFLLPNLLISIATLFVFFDIIKKTVKNKLPALFAITMFSLSYMSIICIIKIKPYLFDLLFACLLLDVFLTLNKTNEQITVKKAIFYTIFGCMICWTSIPSILVLFLYLLILSVKYLIDKNYPNLIKTLISSFIIGMSTVLEYFIYIVQIKNDQGLYTQWFDYGDFYLLPNNLEAINVYIHNALFLEFCGAKLLEKIPEQFLIYAAITFVIGMVVFLQNLLKEDETKYHGFYIVIPVLSFLLLSALRIYPMADRVILFLLPCIILIWIKPFDETDNKFKFYVLNMLLIVTMAFYFAYFFKLNALQQYIKDTENNDGVKETISYINSLDDELIISLDFGCALCIEQPNIIFITNVISQKGNIKLQYRKGKTGEEKTDDFTSLIKNKKKVVFILGHVQEKAMHLNKNDIFINKLKQARYQETKNNTNITYFSNYRVFEKK